MRQREGPSATQPPAPKPTRAHRQHQHQHQQQAPSASRDGERRRRSRSSSAASAVGGASVPAGGGGGGGNAILPTTGPSLPTQRRLAALRHGRGRLHASDVDDSGGEVAAMAALATAGCVVLHYFAAHHGAAGTLAWVQSHAQLVLAAAALVAAYACVASRFFRRLVSDFVRQPPVLGPVIGVLLVPLMASAQWKVWRARHEAARTRRKREAVADAVCVLLQRYRASGAYARVV
jgi:hypothetical protein